MATMLTMFLLAFMTIPPFPKQHKQVDFNTRDADAGITDTADLFERSFGLPPI